MPCKRINPAVLTTMTVLTALLLLFSCAKKEKKKDPDGLSVYRSEGRYGYSGLIDGKPANIEPRYSYAYPFQEGLAVVMLDRKMGYINTKGEFVIPNRFERAYNFSGGLARVRINGKFGFIDRGGELRIDAVYNDAWDFRNGVAKVKLTEKIAENGRFKLVDRVFFIDTDNRTITNFTDAEWTNFPGKMKKY